MAPHRQFIGSSGPGNLPVAVTQLFELQQCSGIEVSELAAFKQVVLDAQHPLQLGDEPGVDAAGGMDLLHAAALQQGTAKRKDPLGGGGAQLGVEFPLR